MLPWWYRNWPGHSHIITILLLHSTKWDDDKYYYFQKCLTTLDLTSLGVGSCVGTGMYLVAGMVARNVAGPGVVVSFIIAAVASIFSGKRNNLKCMWQMSIRSSTIWIYFSKLHLTDFLNKYFFYIYYYTQVV